MTIPRDLSNLAPGANTSGVLQTNKGGTGLTTLTAANNALYSTSASALTAGTLPVAAGGTGATTLTGYVKGSGTSALSSSLTIPTTDLSGSIAVANGGTGATTLTANNVILGNGTSSVQFVAPSTNGNVLTSNGTTWVSSAPAAGLLGQTNSGSPYETSLGYLAGSVSTGNNNTFIGYQAGTSNTSGGSNTAIGRDSQFSNFTNNNNTSVGVATLYYNTANNNNAFGYYALYSNFTGNDNVAVGHSALYTNSSGSVNVAVGNSSLTNNSTGVQNVGIGFQSLLNNNIGGDNTAVGYTAGDRITSGTQNTIIGSGAASSGTNDLTTGSNNIVIGYNAAASSATVSNEATIGNDSIVSTRLRGMVELNAAMFEKATVSATAATGTIDFNTRSQSVLYYTSNASGNWTLNIRASSGVSLDTAMTTGQSLTIAFLVTNGATAYYQTALQVDGASVTPKWQGGTAPTAGNASSIDAYVITIIKTASATFTALASQTRFA